eukprot:CAMPEP_0206046314 /NCGR_PEP_ID=MMETSP1466-20131121/18305_1 /ASSEMBLY_ACC=CAM_ASM_001126 /TAXON_ID=44452 /ORGANISM="Pavlova gyrans, Strain CCMP608" /LENGTH=309 /DNA_ID=CAMNT_0053421289 /DNA_START=17 /DNA_END=946 /DNA_ORIENTATION=+
MPRPRSIPGATAVEMNADDLPPLKLPKTFEVPEPRPLTVPDGQLLSTLTGSVALALRFGSGIFVCDWRPGISLGSKEGTYSLFGFRDTSASLGSCKRPVQPIRLYEYEASPYCRKVREVCGMLDLSVTMLPCPSAREGFAGELKELGGKMQVPYMVDPNTGAAMYESEDIMDYLFDTYGPGRDAIPWITKGPFALWTSAFAAIARGFRGSKRDPKALPENERRQPLELWGYEGSPFVRPVRERLNELALPHTVVFCARGSSNRDRMVEKAGRFQVPFLVDPNTGVELFESDAIVDYLDAVYTSTPDAEQ